MIFLRHYRSLGAKIRLPFRDRNAARRKKMFTGSLALIFLFQITAANSGAYVLGTTVGDMREAATLSGRTACPQLTRFNVSTPGSINRQWSTSLGTDPVTILTVNQTTAGQLTEIEGVIEQALAAWTGVANTSLTAATLGALQQTDTAAACSSSDGLNTICFNQSDPGFTTGLLAFTLVVSADITGEQLTSTQPPSTFVGQILDADVLLRPGDATTTFATPGALAANPNAYDLESIVTHELGHSFGFDHSGGWRAMMFPIAPPPGQITGIRPTAQSPDAQLADDDGAGLRVLYPDPTDAVHVGTISGQVLPANPLVLPTSPAGVTGVFPAQVVAIDNATGAVAAAAFAGWSCSDPGPAQFDESFSIERLTVGADQDCQVYAEPLDGPVSLGNVIYNFTAICRNPLSDPGWPAQYACTVPSTAQPFSTRIWPSP